MKQSLRSWLVAIGSLSLVLAACTPPPSKGSIRVTASGIPAGQTTTVTIKKADNTQADSLTLGNEAKTSKQLDAGTYGLSAEDIAAGGFTYKPSFTPASAVVEANKTTEVALSYAASDGKLTVTIGGLPVGTNGNVTVAKQGGGFNQVLTATTTLSGLAPGTYTITPANVSAGGFTYTAAATTANVTLGATATATVNYGTTGKLSVNISGLPAGTDANVDVTGPSPATTLVDNLKATGTLIGLAAGQYTITPNDVSVGNLVYRAAALTRDVTNGTTATADIVYSTTNGNLAINITGLPGGVTPSVKVEKQGGGYTNTITQNTTINNLAGGSYILTPQEVENADAKFGGAAVNVTVNAGQTVNGNVVYAQTTGDLTVTISGLPGSTNANVSVQGQANPLTVTSTLKKLAPGSYSVTAANVTGSDGFTYAGVVTGSPATVTAGATANAGVAYAATNGNIAITVSGLPTGVGTIATVTGPNSFSQNVNFTTNETKNILAPIGNGYTVTVNPVAKTGTIVDEYYTAANPAPLNVSAAASVPVSISYGKRLSTGQLWIASTIPSGSSGVFSYNQSQLVTGTPTPNFSITANLEQPLGVAFDKQGNLYIANQGNQGGGLYTIVRISAVSLQANAPAIDLTINSKAVTATGVPAGLQTLKQPEYLAFDSQGNLWVGNQDCLVRFNANILQPGNITPDAGLVLFSNTLTSFDVIAGLAIKSNGDVYVSNYNSFDVGRVTRVPASLASGTGVVDVVQNQVFQVNSLSGPAGLAFDSTSDSAGLWVVEQRAIVGAIRVGQITKLGNSFNANDEVVDRAAVITSTAMVQPNAIAFDNAGKVWVTTQNCVGDTTVPCSTLFPSGSTFGKIVQLNPTAGAQNTPAVILDRAGSLTGIAFNLHPSNLPLNGRP